MQMESYEQDMIKSFTPMLLLGDKYIELPEGEHSVQYLDLIKVLFYLGVYKPEVYKPEVVMRKSFKKTVKTKARV